MLASLIAAGVVVYNTFLKRVRLRSMMLWGTLLGCAVGLTPLILVSGANRSLGISDKVFSLTDSAMLAAIGQVSDAYCFKGLMLLSFVGVGV